MHSLCLPQRNLPPVDGGSFPECPLVQLLEKGHVHDTCLECAVFLDGDDRTEVLFAVDEVRRSIQRIDDPLVGGVGISQIICSFFLCDEPVIREVVLNGRDDGILRESIRLCNEVDRGALSTYFQPISCMCSKDGMVLIHE